MIHTLIIEAENLSEVAPLIEFAEKLGVSIKITPKSETRQESSNEQDQDQDQRRNEL